ncbi:MAG: NTP transferase domain-containing protein, partial [Gemmatimonadetes bacterium]|nr:NTP transferase domain-containing protein [Gemmatimonadota bacterium]
MPSWAVILAGGIGKRFAPLSTPERPKQFLDLYGDATLLQHTARRLVACVDASRLLVATNAQHVPLVRQQLPELPKSHIIGEPKGKNTA